nr:DNA-packaging protein [Erwinia mallotivora]
MQKRAEQIIYNQKFTGAAADLLNANIIARELGLADKREVQQTVTDLTDEEIEKRIRELSDAQSQSGAKAGAAGTTRRKKAVQ